MSEQESSTEVEGGNEESSTDSRLRQIIVSFFNIDLLKPAYDDFKQVNWYDVAATTFYIGVVILTFWSLITIFAFSIDYVFRSQTLIENISRGATVLTLTPFFLIIFTWVSRWSWRNIDNTPSSSSFFGNLKILFQIDSLLLLMTSVFSIVIAAAYRMQAHQAYAELFGKTLSLQNVVAVMWIDMVYVGLLLIGAGGFLSFVIEDTD